MSFLILRLLVVLLALINIQISFGGFNNHKVDASGVGYNSSPLRRRFDASSSGVVRRPNRMKISTTQRNLAGMRLTGFEESPDVSPASLGAQTAFGSSPVTPLESRSKVRSLLTEALKKEQYVATEPETRFNHVAADPCARSKDGENPNVQDLQLCFLKRLSGYNSLEKVSQFFDKYLRNRTTESGYALATIALNYWPELIDEGHRFDMINLFDEWTRQVVPFSITGARNESFATFLQYVCESELFPFYKLHWASRYCSNDFVSTVYYRKKDLEPFGVSIRSRYIKYTLSGDPVDTDESLAYFVITEDKRLMVHPVLEENVKLTSLTHGMPVIAAGYIVVRSGVVQNIILNNQVYIHPAEAKENVVKFFKRSGYYADFSVIVLAYKGSSDNIVPDETVRKANKLAQLSLSKAAPIRSTRRRGSIAQVEAQVPIEGRSERSSLKDLLSKEQKEPAKRRVIALKPLTEKNVASYYSRKPTAQRLASL